jgi:hypothetical protein
VAEHGPVLHQPVVKEYLLPGGDIGARVQRPARGIHHQPGNRRLGLVGAVREQAEHEEPEEQDEDHRLDPRLRHQQLPSFSPFHRRLLQRPDRVGDTLRLRSRQTRRRACAWSARAGRCHSPHRDHVDVRAPKQDVTAGAQEGVVASADSLETRRWRARKPRVAPRLEAHSLRPMSSSARARPTPRAGACSSPGDVGGSGPTATAGATTRSSARRTGSTARVRARGTSTSRTG